MMSAKLKNYSTELRYQYKSYMGESGIGWEESRQITRGGAACRRFIYGLPVGIMAPGIRYR